MMIKLLDKYMIILCVSFLMLSIFHECKVFYLYFTHYFIIFYGYFNMFFLFEFIGGKIEMNEIKVVGISKAPCDYHCSTSTDGKNFCCCGDTGMCFPLIDTCRRVCRFSQRCCGKRI